MSGRDGKDEKPVRYPRRYGHNIVKGIYPPQTNVSSSLECLCWHRPPNSGDRRLRACALRRPFRSPHPGDGVRRLTCVCISVPASLNVRREPDGNLPPIGDILSKRGSEHFVRRDCTSSLRTHQIRWLHTTIHQIFQDLVDGIRETSDEMVFLI